MKRSVITIAAIAALVTGLHARTWTSADGSKTFEGTVRSVDANKGTVTVLLANGTALAFPQDKLSEGDIAFLKEWEASNAAAAEVEPDTDSVIGGKVAKAKLYRLDGKRMKKAELTKSPEYYVLYYSASW